MFESAAVETMLKFLGVQQVTLARVLDHPPFQQCLVDRRPIRGKVIVVGLFEKLIHNVEVRRVTEVRRDACARRVIVGQQVGGVAPPLHRSGRCSRLLAVPPRVQTATPLNVLDDVQRRELVAHGVAGTSYVVVRNLVRQWSARRRHAATVERGGEEPAAAAVVLSRRQKPGEVAATLQLGGPGPVEAGGAVAEPVSHHLAQRRARRQHVGPSGGKDGGAVGHVVLIRRGRDAVLRRLARPSAREEQLLTGTQLRANTAHV